MKKQMYLGAGLACLLLSSASARTWTSADGSKTFEAEFNSHDAEKNEVSVTLKGKKKQFNMTKFSKEDHEWVQAKLKEEKEAKLGTFGMMLSGDVLSKLEEGQFVSASVEKEPEYYILYFTASW